MSQECDHCGVAILQGVEYVEGENGEYCTPTCCYDAEVLDIGPDDLPPR